MVEEENGTFLLRVWKPLPSRRIIKNLEGKSESKSQKRTISVNGGHGQILVRSFSILLQFSEHEAGCGPKYVACSSLLCLNLGKEGAFLGVEQVEDSCLALLVESYVIRTRLPVTY